MSSTTSHDDEHQESLVRRSWHTVLSPFSSGALAKLPNLSRPSRYPRADAIPDIPVESPDQRPTVRDYHAINSLPPNVRVPKKLPTSVKVEGKVWFANERTWVSWLQTSILLGTFALALFNASEDRVARLFAYAYALISIGILIYAYVLYQHRITMIRRRDPGHFDMLVGPIVVSVCLFTAILANFLVRVKELREKNIPIPGAGFFFGNSGNSSSYPPL